MVELRPAVFLDRDGVINVDRGYVGQPRDFMLIEGASQAISTLNRSGYLVFVVTNQSGIARGYFTEDDFWTVTDYMNQVLGRQGAHIDDIRFCPFHPNAKIDGYRKTHHWRKPYPGMILDLLNHWAVDLDSSFLIGDSDRDLQAAHNAGIRGHLFTGDNLSDFLREVAPDLDWV
jgi:D-glycero-D-manno-heptose 1,7-bisphosphate phosphatase